MTVGKLMLEVRLNEYADRTANPHVPYTPEEIVEAAVACAEAGATAVHFHGRAADGAPDLSPETYRAVVRGIRERTDLLIHPTLGVEVQSPNPAVRLAAIVDLHHRGIAPDMVPLDMGTTNKVALTPDGLGFEQDDAVYENTIGTLKYFAGELRRMGIKPYLQIWNAPALRLAEAFHSLGILDGPVWLSLGHTNGRMLSSHPGTLAGLRSYLALMPEGMPVQWSVTDFGGDLFELAPEVIDRGGHLSLGLGDYPYRELGTLTNADVTRRAIELVGEKGREIATPAEARAMLGIARPVSITPGTGESSIRRS